MSVLSKVVDKRLICLILGRTWTTWTRRRTWQRRTKSTSICTKSRRSFYWFC